MPPKIQCRAYFSPLSAHEPVHGKGGNGEEGRGSPQPFLEKLKKLAKIEVRDSDTEANTI